MEQEGARIRTSCSRPQLAVSSSPVHGSIAVFTHVHTEGTTVYTGLTLPPSITSALGVISPPALPEAGSR